MKRIYFLIVASLLCAGAVSAQPRPTDVSAKTATAAANPAPPSFEAKYEGGMFGFNRKEVGTLRFDDDNQRLVFFGKDQKEKFHIPYKSVLVVYPQSKSVTSNTGHVVGNLPLPGSSLLGGLIREKRRYLVMHFDDPDVEAARGLVNFKLDNKALLDSVIQSLAAKANLTQRGDAYYRAKKIKNEI